VANVPTAFVYNADFPATYAASAVNTVDLYAAQLRANGGCGEFNMSDREGENGLDFLTAADPRLVVDSSQTDCDGNAWYYPVKFGNPSTDVPVVTGIEARLIEAEAALAAGQTGAWAADLNALRADAADTKITFSGGGIPADSTTGVDAATRVDVMFRERAFWLFGTGMRLDDLRRLSRQYGRNPNTVFPTGTYAQGLNPHLPAPLPMYSTDVSFTLPTSAAGEITNNPYFKGCLTPTSTP
jgi:hypothetical protein